MVANVNSALSSMLYPTFQLGYAFKTNHPEYGRQEHVADASLAGDFTVFSYDFPNNKAYSAALY
jgi:hypothetical protein